ncbi:ABC transporter substrate-binding protein (plasmid) [Thioclava litoralis]|uniref:ABC transporter substrate-binding protein n=1 Tax=Thioclava litoralis TaxID=3076557 RepID=A0ABZ1E475_9RHOB|nr:ABC transporter substrate-binding protein [Thioclava sp. FTW29]
MSRKLRAAVLALVSVALVCVGAAQAQEPARILPVGDAATEFVFALGAGDQVVARDSTSRFPPEVLSLPDIGYMRQLSPEGVLSVTPDLILLQAGAGPPETLQQLRATGLPLVTLEGGFDPAQVLDNIRLIGAALGRAPQADALARSQQAAFAQLGDMVAQGPHPRVMFVLSDQAGRLNVAGAGTGADGILRLAGAENVMADAYTGYRLVSDEAILQAAPDIVVMLDHTGRPEMDAAAADLWRNAALAGTPAGQRQALVRVAPAALAFGPRTAEMAAHLRQDLLAAAAPQ